MILTIIIKMSNNDYYSYNYHNDNKNSNYNYDEDDYDYGDENNDINNIIDYKIYNRHGVKSF